MFRGYKRHNHAPPTDHFDAGLQHERTALAWERTAVATMVAGTILARYAITSDLFFIAFLGVVQVAYGGLMMAWTGIHYDELHGPLRGGDPVVHPTATRWVGRATILFSLAAITTAVYSVAS